MTWLKLFRSRTLERSPSKAVSNVFAVGGVPSVTYVDRDHLGLETRMMDALERRHSFTIVSGPTKCGKSVICERILGKGRHITVQGGQVTTAEDFWRQTAHKLRLPSSSTSIVTKIWSFRWLVEMSSGIPSIFQKKGSIDRTSGSQEAKSTTFTSFPLLDTLEKLKRNDITLIVEDFHYIGKDVQTLVIRSLKSAVFEGMRVVVLAVPHRAFDPADVEGEVEGRVNHVEIPRWSSDDLNEIAAKGFLALGLTVEASLRRRMCDDAFGNPLLIQEICHELSRVLLATGVSQQATATGADLARAYDKVVANKGLSRFDRFAQCGVAGGMPAMAELRTGGEDAMTLVLLAAVARSGLKPITAYPEIRDSFIALSRAVPPSPEQVGALCSSMAAVVSGNRAAPLEWLAGTQELALTDPFLMFYMKWVLHDRRSLILEQSAIETSVGVQPGSSREREDEN
ncbi:hypothetical protein [Sphingobium sp. HWE2-09]|uniref:hypothetical protein n=1 Tax=Sphingobium sp. HWE2-09 TaxID=3108390 RepID=UPI002DD08017|nr:hypothetical protein [Sphingobium sp. HWE2-09]